MSEQHYEAMAVADERPARACPLCKGRFEVDPTASSTACPHCKASLRFGRCPKCAVTVPLSGEWSRWKCLRCGKKHKFDKTAAPAGEIRVLPKGRRLLDKCTPRLRQLLVDTLGSDEEIDFALWTSTAGGTTQALIACPTRFIIGKAGTVAGATLGGLVTSFRYEDVTAIEVRKGPMNGWIEILTPAYQGAPTAHFWSDDEKSDPYKRPNCLPAPWKSIEQMTPYVQQLRDRAAAARTQTQVSAPVQPSTHPPADLPAQLASLAQMHSAGALSDAEFAAAKARLLAT